MENALQTMTAYPPRTLTNPTSVVGRRRASDDARLWTITEHLELYLVLKRTLSANKHEKVEDIFKEVIPAQMNIHPRDVRDYFAEMGFPLKGDIKAAGHQDEGRLRPRRITVPDPERPVRGRKHSRPVPVPTSRARKHRVQSDPDHMEGGDQLETQMEDKRVRIADDEGDVTGIAVAERPLRGRKRKQVVVVSSESASPLKRPSYEDSSPPRVVSLAPLVATDELEDTVSLLRGRMKK